MADVKTKHCWICLGDGDQPEGTDAPADSQGTDRWVHACNCTLVAHESCLVDWIQSSEENPLTVEKQAKCPQCGVPYVFETSTSPLLQYLNRGSEAVALVYRTVALATVLGTMFAAILLYGAVTLRILVGHDEFVHYAGAEWSDWMYTSNLFYGFVSTLIVSEPLMLGSAVFTLAMLTQSRTRNGTKVALPYYPRAALLTWPLVRAAYDFCWSSVVRHTIPTQNMDVRRGWFELRPRSSSLLRSHVNKMIVQAVKSAKATAEKERILNATSAPTTGDNDQAPNDQAPAARPAAEPVPARIVEDDDAMPNNNWERGYRIFSEFLPALITPYIGAGIARVLVLWSRSGLIGSTAIAALLALGQSGQRGVPRFSSWTTMVDDKPMTFSVTTSGEVDPTWWHNVVGISIYMLVSDALLLTHLRLVTRQRYQRKIVTRPS